MGPSDDNQDSSSEENPFLSNDETGIWGMNFLREFVSTGEKFSFENEHLLVGVGAALVSQAVGDSYFYTGDGKQTTRVHPLIIQGSGTGKDPAFSFAKLVARMADIRMSDTNDVTEAGLVGTVREDDEIPGLAKTADIIGFREATSLFRASTHSYNANLAENVNQILDGKQIERKLAEGSLKYKPSCTLVGTTYPPTDLDLQQLMTNGTLARFFYFFKPRGSEFRWDMGSRIIVESIKDTDEEKRLERIQRLGETIEKIQDEFGDGEQFTISEEVEEVVVEEKLREIYTGFNVGTQEIVAPAVTRYHVHFLRVSCLMAALDRCSTTVERQHAEDALTIVLESWRNLLAFFEDHQNDSKDTPFSGVDDSELEILSALKTGKTFTQSELSEATGLSTRTIRKKESRLKDFGLIEVTKDGRSKVYRLRRDEDG